MTCNFSDQKGRLGIWAFHLSEKFYLNEKFHLSEKFYLSEKCVANLAGLLLVDSY